jgi:hypothetical protein
MTVLSSLLDSVKSLLNSLKSLLKSTGATLASFFTSLKSLPKSAFEKTKSLLTSLLNLPKSAFNKTKSLFTRKPKAATPEPQVQGNWETEMVDIPTAPPAVAVADEEGHAVERRVGESDSAVV